MRQAENGISRDKEDSFGGYFCWLILNKRWGAEIAIEQSLKE